MVLRCPFMAYRALSSYSNIDEEYSQKGKEVLKQGHRIEVESVCP
jgi:hypothetical protein